ncbi:selenocysteine synthase [Acinetobacter oleivorans]|uniref:selenocysteine synthase n=1 Tax=Acinetobacter oleivorans TaxID=1148157 RepID=UPI0018FF9FD1|nr:selenocysteine synthase [Acinetobacter oleivorans]MBJ9740569.1 selenocysteine synthase [Acinetobacter oleivorans]MCU4410990.1 selenocysteine synthase [Acinetobacter oleivorans]
MNQFSSFSFQYKSAALVCIYSLGVLALIPHTQFFYNTFKHQRSRRYPYSSTRFTKVKRPSLSLSPCEIEINDALPDDALIQELMAVFGNDTLWRRATQPEPTYKAFGKKKKKNSSAQVSTTNPLSASWATISTWMPFENNLDLGSNSENDVYVQFLAKKKWNLRHNISLDTEQVFRYGSTSRNYTETTLNLTQKMQDNTLFANKFNVNKSENEDYSWGNWTFQQYQFLKDNHLTYGVYSGGVYTKNDIRLNSWGPYISWRQPVWRNWLFMQNDLNFFNHIDDDSKHQLSVQMNLEANF